MAGFIQTGPHLDNPCVSDDALSQWLESRLPARCRNDWLPGLRSLGELSVTEMPVLAAQAERLPPEHVPYDAWGRRVDEIRVSDAWRRLEAIAAEQGVVATAYERADGAWSRVHQFLRLYLYHPNSAICSCPMAMTDGAARIIEQYGDEDLQNRVLPRLLSRSGESFWTSGQWMTERAGGSDVSGTETEAVPSGNIFRLHGVKWFTSATTSPMAMTLARVREGDGVDDRLSLFFVETRDPDSGALQGIRVNRLKDKLGTRALPTAELTLDGAETRLVGERGRGVATISTLLNITRLYNACCAAGYMGTGLALARDYARRRVAFGRPLIDQPLHRETLADMSVEHHAAFQLVFECARLLGREECGEAGPDEQTHLRLLTPVTKLYTARQAVAVCSETLEAFGGAGYVEDTGLPKLLRDAQVLSIWEGTTNVLSLDMLRAMGDGENWFTWMKHWRDRLSACSDADDELVTGLAGQLDELGDKPARLLSGGQSLLEANARGLAFRTAQSIAGILLLEQAGMTKESDAARRMRTVARRWYRRAFTQRWQHPAEEAALILDLDV